MEITNLQTREDIPELLNDLGFCGWGVEVGAHTGWFSNVILNGSSLSKWFAIDTWSQEEPGLSPQTPSFEYFKICGDELWKHGPRIGFIRMPSLEAADVFLDGCFDFVYIDANHLFHAVTEDICAWWPKVRPGGIMAGHDYQGDTVAHAVDRHVRKFGLDLCLTKCDFMHDNKEVRSWLVKKPK